MPKAPRKIIFHLPRVKCAAMYMLWCTTMPAQREILGNHLQKIGCPNYADGCVAWPDPVICEYNKPGGCWTPELIKQISPPLWQQRWFDYKTNRKLTFTNKPMSR